MNENTMRTALSHALTDVMNYPEDVQARLWGAKLTGIIDAATEAVMNTGLVEQEDVVLQRPQVDRVEVIDSTGRAYVNMDASNVSTSLQDGGKTLKIFLDGQKNGDEVEYFVECTNNSSGLPYMLNKEPLKTLEDALRFVEAQRWGDKAIGTTRFSYRILSRPVVEYIEVTNI